MRPIRGPIEVSAPILAIQGLNVRFAAVRGEVEAVRDVGIEVARGEIVAIVGESGSGKSQMMLAALGLLPRNGQASGSVRFEGEEILGAGEAALNKLRGARIAMIFQEPMTSLDPLFSIGAQIAEPLIVHGGLTRRAARRRAVELLRLVGIADPERRIRSYPHQLSGGQRQRVMIAMAIANESGAPHRGRADDGARRHGAGADSRPVARSSTTARAWGWCSSRMILASCGVSPSGSMSCARARSSKKVATGEVMTRPRSAYARALIEAEPSGLKAPPPDDAPVLLEALHIAVTFALPTSVFAKPRLLRAVDDVSLTIRRGQTLGVVGESGSGKSTLARALLRLIPCRGALTFEGRDLQAMDRQELRALRRADATGVSGPFRRPVAAHEGRRDRRRRPARA